MLETRPTRVGFPTMFSVSIIPATVDMLPPLTVALFDLDKARQIQTDLWWLSFDHLLSGCLSRVLAVRCVSFWKITGVSVQSVLLKAGSRNWVDFYRQEGYDRWQENRFVDGFLSRFHRWIMVDKRGNTYSRGSRTNVSISTETDLWLLCCRSYAVEKETANW